MNETSNNKVVTNAFLCVRKSHIDVNPVHMLP